MFSLVLYLEFITLKAEANGPGAEKPEIRLSHSYSAVVWQGKPLKIILEDIDPVYECCYKKYVGRYYLRNKACVRVVPEIESANNVVNILNISNVTAEMSTSWVCRASQDCFGHDPSCKEHENRRYSQIYFNLHVKAARAVILEARDQKLSYSLTNLSVDYDGEAYYTYDDGEDIQISCKNAKDNHNEDTLRLEYYNAEGDLLFKTKPRDQLEYIFRSVLKSINDKYYLDCIRAARDPDGEYRYRTTFLKRDVHVDASQRVLLLSVNSEILPAKRISDNTYDSYVFRYIEGEELIVTCHKVNVYMGGSLYFYKEGINQALRSYFPPDAAHKSKISLNMTTSDIKNKSLNCGISNSNVERPNARLLFLSDVPAYDIRIRGLPRNNILYQYTNDLNQWTIEYQYSVNDVLNLTCVWNKGFSTPHWPLANLFQWKFEDNTIDSEEIGNSVIKFSKIPFTKNLDATHNGTKVKCVHFSNGKGSYLSNKTVEIILRLKTELVSEAKNDEVTSEVTDVKRMIVPIAVAVGVAIAVITMVCLVFRRNRMKRINLIENASDNLSNQNDSQIPAFPSQWEDVYNDPNYDKIDEEVMRENCNYSIEDKLCRMSRRQSNSSENHYTEIDDNVKPKPGGLTTNWNTAQPFDYHTLITRALPNSRNTSCNTSPISNSKKNYNNVPKPSKSINDLRLGCEHSEGKFRHDDRNYESKVKINNGNHYANMDQDNMYMQPGDMLKKPYYESDILQSGKTNNDSNYAEPFDDLEISFKNDFYG